MSNHEGDRPADDGVFSAFPQQALGMDGLPCSEAAPGLSRREHAAITLRVPDSGEPWLDEMIREARRWDAAQALWANDPVVSVPNAMQAAGDLIAAMDKKEG